MSYLKINGNDTKYNVTISPFTSQHGYNAVRFIGEEIPTTDKGFKYYDDNDELISDLSEYIYEYRQNEYCVQEDIIELPKGSDVPLSPSSFDVINNRINQLNNQVSDITPFEETKKGYYGEIEKVFYGVPQGNTTVFFDNYNGEYTVNRVEDRLTIRFPERLKDMVTISVMVNK